MSGSTLGPLPLARELVKRQHRPQILQVTTRNRQSTGADQEVVVYGVPGCERVGTVGDARYVAGDLQGYPRLQG